MPTHIRTLAVVAAAAAAPALAVTALRPTTVVTPPAHVEAATAPDRAITINGDAVINVVPDQATVHLAVDIVHQATPAAATSAAAQRTARILKSTAALGVDAAQMKTEQLSVTPEYRTNKDGSTTVVGYNASRTITVCVKDMKRVDELVDALVKAGANRLDSISFETSDLNKRRAEARLMAVRAAREKGELLAHELGVKLGKPRTITEGNFGWSGPAVYKNVEQSFENGAFVEGAFAPGQMTVNMEVSVIFDLDV